MHMITVGARLPVTGSSYSRADLHRNRTTNMELVDLGLEVESPEVGFQIKTLWKLQLVLACGIAVSRVQSPLLIGPQNTRPPM